jgi:hypothetical protein
MPKSAYHSYPLTLLISLPGSIIKAHPEASGSAQISIPFSPIMLVISGSDFFPVLELHSALTSLTLAENTIPPLGQECFRFLTIHLLIPKSTLFRRDKIISGSKFRAIQAFFQVCQINRNIVSGPKPAERG